jgi:hypothetical protein
VGGVSGEATTAAATVAQICSGVSVMLTCRHLSVAGFGISSTSNWLPSSPGDMK